MKKILVALMVSMLVVSCQEKGGGGESTKISSEEDKTFYAMGVILGTNLVNLNLNDQELSALYKGIIHAAKDKKPEVEMAIYQPKIQAMVKDRMNNAVTKNKEKGKKFIENYLAQNKDAKKLDSGLVVHTLKEGTGAQPKAEDTVEVHYHGTLIDGKVFDSSVDRGKKISFPLNRVIKGWTEGLTHVKLGGKVKLVIPSELAYGDNGAAPKIPGGATLIFEVELFQINPEPPKAPPAPKK